MERMRNLAAKGLIVFLLAGITACAPTVEKKVYDIVWPLPPDEPKVKFVEILQSNLDVEEPSSLGKVLFGEDIVYALQRPYAVAVDKEGRIYATDMGRVFVFDKKNRKFDFIGDEPGTGRLRTPIGIAISETGRVYVTDIFLDKIFVYDLKGKLVTAVGRSGEFENPAGIAVDDRRGRFYVADARKHNVKAYTLDGSLLFTIGKRGNESGEFNFPTNIALDREGNFYVVDTGNFRVQIFNPDGKFIKTIGQVGDTSGSFARPKGIAIDSEDHIYVVDAAFQNFQIFDKEGRLLLHVGGGGSGPGEFSVPAGIFIDDEDRIYVADQVNRRIQVFEYMGEKWKKRQAEAPKPVEKK